MAVSEKRGARASRVIFGLLRVILLSFIVIAAAVFGASFDPLKDVVSELIATSTIAPSATPTTTPTSTSTSTSTDTPTITPTNSPTSTPRGTPTRLHNSDPRLSYLISKPKDLTFSYNWNTDGGSLSWEASDWIPSNPPGSTSIGYEVRVIYPNLTLGPYTNSGREHKFSKLDTDQFTEIEFSITAVGALRVGQYDYEISSESVELSWIKPTPTPTFTTTATSTPTDTPTASATPSETATQTATNTATDTFTPTATFTFTPTATATFSQTPTPTATPTFTPTHTFTASNTPVPTDTATSTATFTPSNTFTPTKTNTPTSTHTPSHTSTSTNTPTWTFTPSDSPTPTDTPTSTPTFTPSPTFTPDVRKMKVLFTVISNGNVNIRSCPGTHCNPPLGVSRRGNVYEVVEQITKSDGEWYLIRYENQPAFIAGWLTTKAAEATLAAKASSATARAATSSAMSTARVRNSRATSTARARKTRSAVSSLPAYESDRMFTIRFPNASQTVCRVQLTTDPSIAGSFIAIGGGAKYSIDVFVMPPNSSRRLSIKGENLLDPGTGDYARVLTLNKSGSFTPGLYTIEVQAGGGLVSSKFNWRLRNTGKAIVTVICD